MEINSILDQCTIFSLWCLIQARKSWFYKKLNRKHDWISFQSRIAVLIKYIFYCAILISFKNVVIFADFVLISTKMTTLLKKNEDCATVFLKKRTLGRQAKMWNKLARLKNTQKNEWMEIEIEIPKSYRPLASN